MDHRSRRPLQRASSGLAIEFPALGLGGAPLGDLYDRLPERQALDTLQAAVSAGVGLFDTSPFYGHGLSEHRFGTVLRCAPRDSFMVSTKVGRVLRRPSSADFDRGPFAGGLDLEADFDYSYDGTMRSFEDSLQRLGLGSIDVLLIHDVDVWTHGTEAAFEQRFSEAMNGAYKALDALRAEGAVKAIGVGINEAHICAKFAEAGDFDLMMLAGRYTLLEQGALDTFLPTAKRRDVSLLLAGPFNSGILVTGASAPGAKYDYQDAPDEVIEKVNAIERVCARHNVPLAAAALQFPLAHEQFVSVVPGAVHPVEAAQHVEWMGAEIPVDLWAELKAEGLLREDAPVPPAV